MAMDGVLGREANGKLMEATGKLKASLRANTGPGAAAARTGPRPARYPDARSVSDAKLAKLHPNPCRSEVTLYAT